MIHQLGFRAAKRGVALVVLCSMCACGDDTGVGASAGTDSDGSTGATTSDDLPATDPTITTGITASGSADDTSPGDSSGGDPCGNETVERGEECDGSDLAGEDCLTQGFASGRLACAADCTFDAAACVPAVCGDDMAEAAEVCDGTDLLGEDCLTQGFDAGDLACGAECDAFDTRGCVTYVCGNDILEGTEVCDGTALSGETCVTQGFDGGELACGATCTLYDTTACFVTETVTTGPGFGQAIPDNGYNGTIPYPSMTCFPFTFLDTGLNTVAGVSFDIGVTHGWIGDLTIKLLSPAGTVTTVLNRPGYVIPDDGTGTLGEASNLVASSVITFRDGGATDAELMGSTISPSQAVCQDDGLCDYAPNADSATPGVLADLHGESVLGDWQLCFGDSGAGETGVIDYMALSINRTL
jgi:subtilisin-like proprotein convertase family protein